MKKKVTVLTAGILCAVGIAVGASSAGIIQTVQSEIRPDFTVIIDGQEQTFKNANGETVYPMLYEGTTYLPLRAIGELMGKTVYWYEDAKRIELKDDTTTVTDADVIVPGGSSVTPSPAPQTSANGITLDRAKEIALERAGISADGVVFTKSELDRDDGILSYELEFYKDGVEYEADIRVSDGTILSWEVDHNRFD